MNSSSWHNALDALVLSSRLSKAGMEQQQDASQSLPFVSTCAASTWPHEPCHDTLYLVSSAARVASLGA